MAINTNIADGQFSDYVDGFFIGESTDELLLELFDDMLEADEKGLLDKSGEFLLSELGKWYDKWVDYAQSTDEICRMLGL